MVFLISLAAFALLAILGPSDLDGMRKLAPLLALSLVVCLASGLRELFLWFTGRGPFVRRAERRQRRAVAG